jgi:hypothetical protein
LFFETQFPTIRKKKTKYERKNKQQSGFGNQDFSSGAMNVSEQEILTISGHLVSPPFAGVMI